MVRTIRTREELEAIIEEGVGFIYNDFGGSRPKDCPVHAVTCYWVRAMLKVRPGFLGVKKLWSASLEELIEEVVSRGKVYVLCGSESLLPSGPGSTSARPASTHAGAPRPRSITQRHRVTSGVSTDAPQYRLRIHDPRRGPVEAWSSARLQFEPNGWMREMRDAIGSAASGLIADPGEVLHAVYTSPSKEMVDAENVLFYNVGTGRFAKAARYGLLFERRMATVTAPPGTTGSVPQHHVAYDLRANREPRCWVMGARLIEWKAVPCPPLHEFTRLSEIWLDMKRASGSIRRTGDAALPPAAHFAVEVEIARGASGSRNVAALIKPLLDGVIAAMHVHDGTDAANLAARLSRRHSVSPAHALALLQDDSFAVLGARRLLWRWRDSVQWNPADDMCVVGSVLAMDESVSSTWSHSGRVVAVIPADLMASERKD